MRASQRPLTKAGDEGKSKANERENLSPKETTREGGPPPSPQPQPQPHATKRSAREKTKPVAFRSFAGVCDRGWDYGGTQYRPKRKHGADGWYMTDEGGLPSIGLYNESTGYAHYLNASMTEFGKVKELYGNLRHSWGMSQCVSLFSLFSFFFPSFFFLAALHHHPMPSGVLYFVLMFAGR